MRVQVGHALRTRRGDTVTLTASLLPGSPLGRLFVFVKERENDTFSPYVPGLVTKMAVVTPEPPMFRPMMFRVTDQEPQRAIAFVSDIDGRFALMQEVDSKTEPRVRVQWQRQINPLLPPMKRVPLLVGAWLSLTLPSLLNRWMQVAKTASARWVVSCSTILGSTATRIGFGSR